MELNSKLWKAVTERNAAKATEILKKKPWFGQRADLNQINLGPKGLHPLIHWIEEQDVEWVKWALAHGADPNVRDTQDRNHLLTKGSTPLTTAIRGTLFYGFRDAEKGIQIIESLLTSGADVNLGGREGHTPLHEAAGHLERPDRQSRLICLLLKTGANPSAKDNKGDTPLHHLFNGVIDSAEAAWICVEMLLQAGANVNARDENGETPLHKAAGNLGRWTQATTLAMKMHQTEPLDLDAQNIYGHTPLHIASTQCRLEAVRLLLAEGANSQIRDNKGQTPLERARNNATSGGERWEQLIGELEADARRRPQIEITSHLKTEGSSNG